jgi:outer membrane lipoprotein SlyB
MVTGSTLGSVLPGIGTVIGAAVGLIVGLVGGAIVTAVNGAATEAEKNAITEISKARKEKGNYMFVSDAEFEKFLKTELKIKDKNLINSLVKNREAIEELTAVETARLN